MSRETLPQPPYSLILFQLLSGKENKGKEALILPKNFFPKKDGNPDKVKVKATLIKTVCFKIDDLKNLNKLNTLH